MWLYLALLGFSCLAIVSILDKFILSNEKVSPIVFVFYSTVFLFPLVFVIPWLSRMPTLLGWTLIAIGATAFTLSLWTMYLAFQKSEVSHVGPLIGAFIPLFILAFSRFFLGEHILPTQIFGIILLSVGSLLISIQKRQSHHDAWRSLKFGIMAAVLFSVFHVTAKSLYTTYGFSHGFIYLWGAVGVIGMLLFLSKEVRQQIFPGHKFNPRSGGVGLKAGGGFDNVGQPTPTSPGRASERRPPKRGIQVMTVVVDKILGIIGVVLVQYSVSLGSVTRVNALGGFQYGLLVILVAGLTKFWPAVFKEHYQRGEFKRELLAVSIIAIGLVYLVR